MRNRKWSLLLIATALVSLPALAQPLEKNPTPPPATDSATSIIGPSYADAPEYVVKIGRAHV